MTMNGSIFESNSDPQVLEAMYQDDPAAFTDAFEIAWQKNPESLLLQFWYHRLHYVQNKAETKQPLISRDLAISGVFAVLAGLCTRIALFYVVEGAILPINVLFGVVPFLVAALVYFQPTKKAIIVVLSAAVLLPIALVFFYSKEGSDSVILAQLHLPVFLWVALGLAYTGNQFRSGQARLAFLQFNGDFAVLYAIMAICGIVLTGLTVALFGLAKVEIVEIYMQNVVVFGAAALAVAAIFLLIKKWVLPKNIVPIIATIFSPLVLATLVVFLGTILTLRSDPFKDRDFLMVFNGVLLFVLVVTIFSITERNDSKNKTVSDGVITALNFLALAIDIVAVAAILFRLTSYGSTPNRIAVLGVNLLVGGHLTWILATMLQFMRGKTQLRSVQNAVTTYLPIYGIWAAFVASVFPFVFR